MVVIVVVAQVPFLPTKDGIKQGNIIESGAKGRELRKGFPENQFRFNQTTRGLEWGHNPHSGHSTWENARAGRSLGLSEEGQREGRRDGTEPEGLHPENRGG